jgi:DNA mismatch endonuclease (patch repair protein)
MLASSNAVSRRMARTAGKDNPRELALRSALHHQGLRFRIHYAALAGTRRTIDIAFTRLRLAVFCDGCFWHGCPIHATAPKANREWWADKLATNKARDLDTDTKLANGGWTVLRIWEHVPIDDAVALILSRLQQISACMPARAPQESER